MSLEPHQNWAKFYFNSRNKDKWHFTLHISESTINNLFLLSDFKGNTCPSMTSQEKEPNVNNKHV